MGLDERLDGDNQYVNFTRLAEERYGFNALHPRLAAQRERLARVAAAGAALENAHKNGGNSGSGDEMSVDLSDGEADNSNVEMGGINDGERIPKSGEETGEAGVAKKPRKRLMKEDMYDKEDDFIDDTELIWEEQAATSKDGFFVYSGPLIPPGEEPTVERYVKLSINIIDVTSLTPHRAEGPAKRGRGSGRGRGGTTRGAARAAKAGAKAPGRKPRVTKAAKEQMESKHNNISAWPVQYQCFMRFQLKTKNSACRASTGYENGIHSPQRAITLLLGSFLNQEATRNRKGSLYVMAYHECLQMTES